MGCIVNNGTWREHEGSYLFVSYRELCEWLCVLCCCLALFSFLALTSDGVWSKHSAVTRCRWFFGRMLCFKYFSNELQTLIPNLCMFLCFTTLWQKSCLLLHLWTYHDGNFVRYLLGCLKFHRCSFHRTHTSGALCSCCGISTCVLLPHSPVGFWFGVAFE